MADNIETIIVGKCPWCGKNIKEINTDKGKMWVHEGKTEECSFVLFEKMYIMGTELILETDMIKSFLNEDTVELSLLSKKGNTYKANIKLEKAPKEYKDKKYPSFVIDSFVDKYENKEKKNKEEKNDPFPDIEL